ncbi:outer membrane protein assembly factor BamD [Sandaracinobacter neustonicus]|uniref:Outer membrane protein assembly factor BamD n=1 Tax=Sandaracinobacter neustonicus TaxID=1715348 RepID=A0A501XG00_9SPHN|nr:outer membrane protein assembly factor BamD [Sandaracinobacter neustonicus]TPE59243.1 outer membrane protein assembly factor BamD [Sandaracinobacter neustonicus]
MTIRSVPAFRVRPTGRMPTGRMLAASLLAVSLALTAGCARNRNKPRQDQAYVARDVETLYSIARDTLEKGDYKLAAMMFDEVERQHPYSVWARRAQLMSAFSYYASRQYPEAIMTSQRFLSLHPGNRDAPYAYYIIALSYYEQIADVARDQKITQQALTALQELVRRFPDSRYAADARLKIDLVNDHLAGKELDVGRFYARNRQWISAAVRYRNVIDEYQTTSHVPEALYRLVEANLALGLQDEALRNAAVLSANYPGSKWYERAYALMRKYAPNATVEAPKAAGATPGGA